MKGILLAGGTGSRLYPLTKTISKQLLPIYNKPAIYYPLTTLMLANIRDVLVVSNPKNLPAMKDLLEDGSDFGINISYLEQLQPNGIAEVFLLAKDFCRNEKVCLILGDNIFYGFQLQELLARARQLHHGAYIFGYPVRNPSAYGVAEIDTNYKVISLIEKPQHPKSNLAVTGLYFYDEQVCEYARSLKPSARGELEITDLNNIYLRENKLDLCPMGRGIVWFDIGAFDQLIDAGAFIQTIEQKQGLKIGVPEEIAFNKGWIDQKQLEDRIFKIGSCEYGSYLKNIESSAI